MWTLKIVLVPITTYNRPRNLRISQSAVFCLVPKSADFEVLVYVAKKKFAREKVLHFPYVADMLEVDYAEMVLRRTLNI